MAGTVYAGVAGFQGTASGVRSHGLFRLAGGNGAWQELTEGLPNKVEVRCLVLPPGRPGTIYAGTQDGPYRSDDGGETWRSLGLPGPDRVVWSIALHPKDPDTIFVGVEGFAIFRSRDAGQSWQKLPVPTPKGGPQMTFATRVVRIVINPDDADEIYAGLEVAGVVRSRDGGDSWHDVSGDLLALARHDHLKSALVSGDPNEGMMDTHALTVGRSHDGIVFLANRMGLFRSADKGKSWREIGIGRFSDLTYARDVQASPHDPNRLYAALSIAADSEAGALYRSNDFGETWRRFDENLPIQSTLMIIAQSRADPDRVYCGARRGQIFGTEDGGKSWREAPLPDGVGGIYALACD